MFLAGLLAVAIPATALAQAPGLETGLHYYALENLTRGEIDQRGIAGSQGVAFENLILAPNTRYRAWIVQAATLRMGQVEFVTGPPGQDVTIPEIRLGPGRILDEDGDGLPDLAETILGTDSLSADSDGDGVVDGAEVIQGTDPLDGLAVRTGVIASVLVSGEAIDLCAAGDLLVVANGIGVVGFNIFTGMNPQVVMSVSLPGFTTAVACSRGRIAAASGDGGLVIVDSTDPPAAGIAHQIAPSLLRGVPQAVAAAADIAYTGLSTGDVVSVDMKSGFILGRLRVDDQVGALRISSGTLYAGWSNRLYSIRLDPIRLVELGSVVSPVSLSILNLAAGSTLVYGAHLTGFNTFDVSDPAAPALLNATFGIQGGWRDVAVNGSGLLVGAVGAAPPPSPADLFLYDVSNPAAPQFLTEISTPGAARAVEIASGLAYVADEAAGIQVVNYLAFDTGGVPPEISLAPSFDISGVEEGKGVFVTANVTDDVQVRSVEFVVDGVTTTDPGFPFEHYFVTPRRAEQTSLRLRARAFDTGGSSTATAEIVVPLTQDVTPPVVLNTVPPDGRVLGELSAIAVTTNEPLDPATLGPATFALSEAGPDGQHGTADDIAVAPGTLEFRDEALTAFLGFAQVVPPGSYEARLDASVRDRAGNPIGVTTEWEVIVYGDAGQDRDGDGVPDALEPLLGLDPDDPDSDADGIPDGEEDFDGDGLINAFEVVLGLDPTNPDTDGDGVPDGENDTDGDGSFDSAELAQGTDPFDYRSFPITTAVSQIVLVNRGGRVDETRQITVLNGGNQGFSLEQIAVENTGGAP
ncbi:MAG: hypothetical protein L0206_01190 [Actinobacteria bacterium]|nr:hypothetical protein [Actinomycetota bacterium]